MADKRRSSSGGRLSGWESGSCEYREEREDERLALDFEFAENG
jgi:hypothetical protein